MPGKNDFAIFVLALQAVIAVFIFKEAHEEAGAEIIIQGTTFAFFLCWLVSSMLAKVLAILWSTKHFYELMMASGFSLCLTAVFVCVTLFLQIRVLDDREYIAIMILLIVVFIFDIILGWNIFQQQNEPNKS